MSAAQSIDAERVASEASGMAVSSAASTIPVISGMAYSSARMRLHRVLRGLQIPVVSCTLAGGDFSTFYRSLPIGSQIHTSITSENGWLSWEEVFIAPRPSAKEAAGKAREIASAIPFFLSISRFLGSTGRGARPMAGCARVASGSRLGRESSARLGLKEVFYQDLGDLHAVQRRALADVIRHHPEIQASRMGDIFPNAAHIDRVVVRRLADRGGPPAVLALVHHFHTRRLAQEFARRLGSQFFAGFDVHQIGRAHV